MKNLHLNLILMIYCIMAKGPALTDRMNDFLFDIAQEMFANKRTEQKIASHHFEGSVKTKWKQASMGYVYGIVFTAHIECDDGIFWVEYIVREADFNSDKIKWRREPALPTFSRN